MCWPPKQTKHDIVRSRLRARAVFFRPFPQHSSNREPILQFCRKNCATLQWHAWPNRMSAITRDLNSLPCTTVLRQGLTLAYTHASNVVLLSLTSLLIHMLSFVYTDRGWKLQFLPLGYYTRFLGLTHHQYKMKASQQLIIYRHELIYYATDVITKGSNLENHILHPHSQVMSSFFFSLICSLLFSLYSFLYSCILSLLSRLYCWMLSLLSW